MTQAIDDIESFARSARIDADIWHSGNLAVSSAPSQDERLQRDLEANQQLGLTAFTFLNREQVQERLRASTLRMGVFEPHCLILDPAKLVRGLGREARRRGVRVFEHSAARVESAPGRGVVATTDHGSVQADRALIATDAYTHACPELGTSSFTVYAYAVATRPLSSSEWDSVGWKSRCGVEDKRLVVHGYRPTADGRIVFCGRDAPFSVSGPDPKLDENPEVFRRLRESFDLTFPQLSHVPFDVGWGGPIGATLDAIPSVHWLGDSRILYTVGYSGHGVGPSYLFGKIARDLLLDRRTDDTALPFTSHRSLALPPGKTLRRMTFSLAEKLIRKLDDDPKDKLSLTQRWLLRVLE